MLAEKVLDANGFFLNDEQPTRQDPATGSFSSPDITVAHETLMNKCDWTPCDFLASDHRPILITLDLPNERIKCQKRLL